MICCDTYYMIPPYSWIYDAHDMVPSYLKYDVVIRITWYHRIHGLKMPMIQWHRIYNMLCCDTYYMASPYT